MRRFIAIIMMVSAAVSMAAAGTIEKEFDIAGGKKLILDLDTGGAIYIKGWDKDKVLAKIHAVGVSEDEYEINFDPGSSALKITSDYRGRFGRHEKHGGDFEFDIKVPDKFDIDIRTMGGEVYISDVEGSITGNTMGGDLGFKNLKGDIEFETMGGGITVEDVTGSLDLETKGGNITVHDCRADGEVSTLGGTILIEDVDGNLKGTTMGGKVTYKNVTGVNLTDDSDGKVVRVSSMGGEINIDNAPNGASLETMGGGITVNSAKEFVRAETMGGDISIYEIDGGVEASTMGGNVNVNMVGDPNKGDRDADISSMGGDVELTVPDGLSMSFDIDIAITKDAHRDYDIISDFDMKKGREDSRGGFFGDRKEHIYGTGDVNGGKNRIKIRTVNGDVYIKKGK